MSDPEAVDEVMEALRARIQRQEARLAAEEARLLERRRDELERVVASDTKALTELAASGAALPRRRARTLLGDTWRGTRSKVRRVLSGPSARS